MADAFHGSAAALDTVEVFDVPVSTGAVPVVEHYGAPWVAFRQAVSVLGLDYRSAYRRLRDSPWARTDRVYVRAADGKRYRSVIVNVRTFLMFMATVQARGALPEYRDAVVAFQCEGLDAIDAWFAARTPSEPDPAAVEAVIDHAAKLCAEHLDELCIVSDAFARCMLLIRQGARYHEAARWAIGQGGGYLTKRSNFVPESKLNVEIAHTEIYNMPIYMRDSRWKDRAHPGLVADIAEIHEQWPVEPSRSKDRVLRFRRLTPRVPESELATGAAARAARVAADVESARAALRATATSRSAVGPAARSALDVGGGAVEVSDDITGGEIEVPADLPGPPS